VRHRRTDLEDANSLLRSPQICFEYFEYAVVMTQTFKPKPSDAMLAQRSLQAFKLSQINLPQLEADSTIAHAIQNVLLHFSRGEAIQVLTISEELTTQQAAEILGISRPHFVKLLGQGLIPFYKVGNQRRVRLSDVQAYQRQLREAALDELSQLQQDMELNA
jgi:excisionase family DNA binding protein